MKKRIHKAWVSVLVVAAFAINGILGPFVFVLHEHVWCVEHYQLRHVHGHHAHEDFGHLDGPVAPDQRASLKADEPCCSPDHEECPLLAQLLQPQDAGRASGEFQSLDDSDPVGPESHQPFSFQQRHRFAPKQSPPTA